MKGNKLMVGDWVCIDGNYELDCPMQIQAVFDNGDAMLDNDIIDEFLPIPLNAEILEKNGFDANIVTWWYADKYDDLQNRNTYEIGINGEILSVKGFMWYVHELQHALRLCGLSELADNLVL